ncbi:carbon starvation protein A [bacterium]|nr:carbon starvation protein A [bacterium]
MNSLVLLAAAAVLFVWGYRFYSRHIVRRVFRFDDSRPTPAHEQMDGVDYVPTRPAILFGHHFATIAGVSPIVGPAIAVFWGWLPAFLWVVLGSVLLGAVHDLGAMYVSLRHRGRSIGDLTGAVVGPRSRFLFLWIIFCLLLLVLAVFALIIARLIHTYPQTVVPVLGVTAMAMVAGVFFRRRESGLWMFTILAVVIAYVLVVLGVRFPISLPSPHAVKILIGIILAYSYFAAVLPVWLLLQPRDHINAWALFAGMGLIIAGLVLAHPTVVAPAIHYEAFGSPGAPPLFPILFITIACGAISGFHCLVSSGTSVRQLRRESDARPVAYGAMLTEGALSVLAIVVCCSAVDSGYWFSHYGAWGGDGTLGAMLEPFINGSAFLIERLGIGVELARTIIAVVIIGFALTTIDSCMRLQRYVVAELFSGLPGCSGLRNRYAAGGLAIATAMGLCYGFSGGGVELWPLFGATNQLLAALALLVTTTYLVSRRLPVRYTLPPMLFVFGVTEYALVLKLKEFWFGPGEAQKLLGIIGLLLLVFSLWMIVEAVVAVLRAPRAAWSGESEAVIPPQS